MRMRSNLTQLQGADRIWGVGVSFKAQMPIPDPLPFQLVHITHRLLESRPILEVGELERRYLRADDAEDNICIV